MGFLFDKISKKRRVKLNKPFKTKEHEDNFKTKFFGRET